MLIFSTQSHATRVTHTYVDGSGEVYYTDMDCSDVHAWVAQHPEWLNIVSCDPEVIIAPPTNGTLTVNSVEVKVPTLTDFSSWTNPKGNAAIGYTDRINNKQASVNIPSNTNSYLLTALAGVVGIAMGFVFGRKRNG